MIVKSSGPESDKVNVTFHIPPSLWAENVYLVGDFNNWNRRSLPLQVDPDDGWGITIELEKGRSYEYRYLLDGRQWFNDCNPDRFTASPMGGDNSVLET